MSEDLNSEIMNQFNVERDKNNHNGICISRGSSNNKSNYNVDVNSN